MILEPSWSVYLRWLLKAALFVGAVSALQLYFGVAQLDRFDFHERVSSLSPSVARAHAEPRRLRRPSSRSEREVARSAGVPRA